MTPTMPNRYVQVTVCDFPLLSVKYRICLQQTIYSLLWAIH